MPNHISFFSPLIPPSFRWTQYFVFLLFQGKKSNIQMPFRLFLQFSALTYFPREVQTNSWFVTKNSVSNQINVWFVQYTFGFFSLVKMLQGKAFFPVLFLSIKLFSSSLGFSINHSTWHLVVEIFWHFIIGSKFRVYWIR